jgi:two-component system chemotaxis response regulator CheB
MPVRVLTVDDSPFFLEVLAGIINSEPGLTVVGSARDGAEALEKIMALAPDVVTLDVEMPVMDGLVVLERMMSTRPTPTIMVSAHTRRASAATVRALRLGACDFVEKPDRALRESREALRAELVDKIKAIGSWHPAAPAVTQEAADAPYSGRRPRIVVIGASTGGTTVLARICEALPRIMRATVVVVQHLPGLYTHEFAKHLSETARCPVHLGRDGALVERGVFIAPGGFHLTVHGTSLRVSRGEPVNRCIPSIDVTMSSVARGFGPAACGVLLTGMGRDGVNGIAEIKAGGGATMAQDEATSAVFGMPRAAIAAGTVDFVLSDKAICRGLAEMVGE